MDSERSGGDPRRPRKRARRWAFRIAAAVLVPLIFFALVEGGFRVAGYGYDPRFFVERDFGEGKVWTENPKFGWRFFPPRMARTPYATVLPARKEPGEFRVFVLGESAAMGDPETSYGMSRILEAMLRESLPGRKVRVVNAAMTGINSHVMTAIAEDCARMEPDLFVVYAGNNEVIGPYGPGTAFARAQSLPLVRLGMRMRTLRFGQFLASLGGRTQEGADGAEQWGGIRMFMGHRIAADDPALEAMRGNFEANLESVVASARSAGASAIVCTVAVNLRDCPPFASIHPREVSTGERNGLDPRLESGVQALRENRFADAAASFAEVLAAEEAFAEAHFLAARANEGMGDREKAAEHYARARDLDALRFRTDSKLNATVRDLFAGGRTEGVRLVDIEAMVAERSPGAAPGNDWFVDHVHFDFAGNVEVANALCAEILAEVGDGEAKTFGVDEMRRRMAYTDFDDQQIAAAMRGRYAKPPYTEQFDHEADVARWEDRVRGIEASLTPELLEEQAAWHEEAVRTMPDDWAAHSLRARYASRINRADREAQSWTRVLEIVPHAQGFHSSLAQALARAGRFQEATDHAWKALEADPANASAYNALGIAYAGMNDKEKAEAHYRKALELRPDYAEVMHNLGVLQLQQGTAAEQLESLAALLAAEPGNVGMRVEYARVLASEHRLEDAEREYRTALVQTPEPAPVRFALARIAYDRGDVAQAFEHLTAAKAVDPAFADTYDLLGLVLGEMQRLDEAAKAFEEALRLRPGDAQAMFHLGVAFELQGKPEEALKRFDGVVALDPTYAEAHRRAGAALQALGRHAEAKVCFRKALSLNADWPEVQNELAWILATEAEPSAGDADEAVRLAEKACEATAYGEASYVDTLATAYAAAGDFPKAAETARTARGLASGVEGGEALAADIATRLEMFENGKAYRVTQ